MDPQLARVLARWLSHADEMDLIKLLHLFWEFGRFGSAFDNCFESWVGAERLRWAGPRPEKHLGSWRRGESCT